MNSDQVKMLTTLSAALAYQAWLLEPPPRRDLFWFGGSRKLDDLLDFLVWKHQADKLGVELTEADVIREVNRDAGGQAVLQGKSLDKDERFKQFLAAYNRNRREGGGLTAADLVAALTDEFRVALAQEALLGQGSGVRAYRAESGIDRSPAAATPDEFLRYFREQRTTLRVALLPVPVDSFLGAVQGGPSDKELEYRYDKYKDQEPDPARREPGFKQPRRIKVEYVSASPQDPFYKEEAKKLADRLVIFSGGPTQAALRFSAPWSVTVPGAGVAGGLSLAALPLAFHPLAAEYAKYESAEYSLRPPPSLQAGFDLNDRARQPAALVGQLVGDRLTGAGALAAPLAGWLGRAACYDTVRTFSGSVLACASPSPFSAIGVAFPEFPTKPPYDAARPRLMTRLEDTLAKSLLAKNLATLKDELVKNKANPRLAQGALDKAVKQSHLRLEAMKEPQSQHDIGKDPSWKDLKAVFDDQIAQSAPFFEAQNQPVPTAAESLFRETGIYTPAETRSRDQRTFLWWRSEDLAARVRDFKEVRPEVERAWRIEKARRLARDKAEKVRDEVKAQSTKWPKEGEGFEREALDFLNTQALKGSEAFTLDNVALLLHPAREVMMGVGTRKYRPYRVPAAEADRLPYPPADFVKQLLTLQNPGDALVIKDQPASHFYVAVLLVRSEPTRKEFYDLYREVARDADPLWDFLLAQERNDYRQRVLRQLRRETGAPVDEEGKFILPEDVRTRFAGSGEGRE
jgi:hypothetical protein